MVDCCNLVWGNEMDERILKTDKLQESRNTGSKKITDFYLFIMCFTVERERERERERESALSLQLSGTLF